jgi:Flp pilus assembly protein TadG
MTPQSAAERSARRPDAEKGSELVELAIVMPIFLILLMGIMDFGFLFQRYELIVNGAREGARAAAAGALSDVNAETRIVNYLTSAGLENPGNAQVDVGDTTMSVGGVVVATKTATVVYPSSFIFLPGSVNLRAVSTMRVEGGS